jgi:hypothetical protein
VCCTKGRGERGVHPLIRPPTHIRHQVRDVVEPSMKPGDSTLQLLGTLTVGRRMILRGDFDIRRRPRAV